MRQKTLKKKKFTCESNYTFLSQVMKFMVIIFVQDVCMYVRMYVEKNKIW